MCNGRKWIADFMRDVRREPPQRGELGLRPLLLYFRQILKKHQSEAPASNTGRNETNPHQLATVGETQVSLVGARTRTPFGQAPREVAGILSDLIQLRRDSPKQRR